MNKTKWLQLWLIVSRCLCDAALMCREAIHRRAYHCCNVAHDLDFHQWSTSVKSLWVGRAVRLDVCTDANPDTMDLSCISSCRRRCGPSRFKIRRNHCCRLPHGMVEKFSSGRRRTTAKQGQLGFNIGLDAWVRQALGATLISQLVGNLVVPSVDCFCFAVAHEMMGAPSTRTRR
jgi:hypothetical protein